MQNHEIVAWIRKVLRADYYMQFNVDLEGTTEKTEGYASDMVFAKVTLAGNDKKRKELNLAIKFGKKALRKIPVLRAAYIREINFYNEVLELFQEHQKEKNIAEPFDAMPKCHTTYLDDNMEIIVLENLYTRGFSLHPRDLTMNLNHIKLVFKNFAKFHALSFSLKEQKREEFKKVGSVFMVTRKIFDGMDIFFKKCSTKISKTLKDANRNDLSVNFDNLVQQGMDRMINNILEAAVDKAVIIHSDCHCNNFMFQYKDNDKTDPINAAILDWQVARYHSPVIDLSYFLYCVASKTELTEWINLLKDYHGELSKFLTQLGNDADSLFPFSALMDHWKKYSFFGFAYASSFMDFNFVKNDSAPSLDTAEEESSIAENLSNITLENPLLYTERLIAIVEHYLDNINRV